jgi:hypothetical protein
MTPHDLNRTLHDLGLDPAAPDVVARLEARAEAWPADLRLRRALLDAHAQATAGSGLRPVVAGVRREALVRWDAWTTTWEGFQVDDGAPALVRAPRPEAARDPLLRRQLQREGRALRAVLPVEEHEGALVLPLPGPAFRTSPAGGIAGDDAFPGLVARTLAGVVRWEDAGLGVPRASAAEVRDAGDRLVIATLTLPEPGGTVDTIVRLAAGLRAWWSGSSEHPLAALLDGLVAAPPEAAAEASERCVTTLAEMLAATRHDAVRLRRRILEDRRHERLEQAVLALEAAVPPPSGVAALGVDLHGATLVVRSDGERITWGPAGAEALLWDVEDGFDVPAARRLVRARGAAPVSARLNREIGGDPVFAEAVARWVSAALDLRTVAKLLEAGLAGG